jgi:hypothetical protein
MENSKRAVARTSLYPTTYWHIVGEAARGETPEGRLAQNELCRLYWFPLYAFARGRGFSEDKASDLTQGFFTRFLAKNDVAAADRERGRFRWWLQKCFKHYVANSEDRDRTIKNGGKFSHEPFDVAKAERCLQAVAHHLSPEAAYERCYAKVVFDRARAALAKEWSGKKRAAQYRELKDFVTYEDERRYLGVAAKLATSVVAVKTEVHRLRERFRDLLRGEVEKTVQLHEDVDDELRSLLQALVDDRGSALQLCPASVGQ